MIRRSLTWQFIVALVAFAGSVGLRNTSSELLAGKQNDTTNDKAKLILALPPGVAATVDGKPVESNKEIVLPNLAPGEVKSVKVETRFEDKTGEHFVELEAGQLVRFSPPLPGTKRASMAVSGPTSGILALALSADGRYLATGSWGKNVALWDLRQGRVVRSFQGHTDRVLGVSLSPDGKQLASASADGSTILWDTASGQKLKTFAGHKGEINGVAFSPDGSFLLTGAQDGIALLWNVATGEPVRAFPGHKKDVTSVAFRPDGKQIVTGADDNSAAIWDLETGKKLFTLKHGDLVKAVAYCADGSRIVTACWDNSAHVWNADTGAKIATTKAQGGDCFGAAITPSGRRVISGARDGSVYLSDAQSGAKIRDLGGHREEVMCAAATKDGRLLLTGAMDSSVRLWDPATGLEVAILASTDDGKDWAVAAPEGAFDASLGGRDLVGYDFADKNSSATADQFSKNGYHPGLLTALMQGERIVPDPHFAQSPPPVLKIVSPRSGSAASAETQFTIQATSQGGGISNWRVYHNGVRVSPEIAAPKKDQEKLAEIQFRLSLLAGNNSVRVTATNADGSWASRAVESILFNSLTKKPKQRLHVIAGGFPGDGLKFPKKNAQAVLERLPPIKAKSFEKVETADVSALVTKKDVLTRITEIGKGVSQDDTILLYLSGFSTFGKNFFVHPNGIKSSDGASGDSLEQNAISLEDLCSSLARLPGLHRVLVLETVAVPKSLDFADAEKISLRLRGAIERAAWEPGIHILASIAESEQPGTSQDCTLLTDILLAGAPDRAKGSSSVDVHDWFASVVSRVQEDAAEASKIITECSSQANSFPLIQASR